MLSPHIEISFGDGDHLCALLLPQLVDLEEFCGFTDIQGNRRKKGVVAIYGEIVAGLTIIDGEIVAIPQAGMASGPDCREIIRLGLIGGGLDPVKARRLVESEIDTQPIVKRWTVAAAILKAAVEGHEPKKAGPAVAPASKTRRRRSTPAKSSSTAG